MQINQLKKVDNNIYELPSDFDSKMRVPVRLYTSENILASILDDDSLKQLINVASLPGVTWRALGMPDAHQGYGFPIGGVAAMDLDKGGIISPGGVGFDINCGIRLASTGLKADQLDQKVLSRLADAIFSRVPSGVGKGGEIDLSGAEIDKVLNKGAEYTLRRGWAKAEDLKVTEEGGRMEAADSESVSAKAKERGEDQLGTLGSGNHFLELQKVEKILDRKTARAFGLKEGELTVMIHCGSRGLGHQVAKEYSNKALEYHQAQGRKLPSKKLAYAEFESSLGQSYFEAMAAAANYAWTNRQLILFRVRQAFREVLGSDSQANLSLVYDLCHNVAKRETHQGKEFIVHRKGATRSFGPSRTEIPSCYEATGQPVLIPGSMGTSSWVLRGTDTSEELSFSSTCHGAGRTMSRNQARKEIHGADLKSKLESKGLLIRANSMKGLAEEGSYAYKDVNEVVKVVSEVGLAGKVAQLKSLAVIKG